jgi:hypothetical protein
MHHKFDTRQKYKATPATTATRLMHTLLETCMVQGGYIGKKV